MFPGFVDLLLSHLHRHPVPIFRGAVYAAVGGDGIPNMSLNEIALGPLAKAIHDGEADRHYIKLRRWIAILSERQPPLQRGVEVAVFDSRQSSRQIRDGRGINIEENNGKFYNRLFYTKKLFFL